MSQKELIYCIFKSSKSLASGAPLRTPC